MCAGAFLTPPPVCATAWPALQPARSAARTDIRAEVIARVEWRSAGIGSPAMATIPEADRVSRNRRPGGVQEPALAPRRGAHQHDGAEAGSVTRRSRSLRSVQARGTWICKRAGATKDRVVAASTPAKAFDDGLGEGSSYLSLRSPSAHEPGTFDASTTLSRPYRCWFTAALQCGASAQREKKKNRARTIDVGPFATPVGFNGSLPVEEAFRGPAEFVAEARPAAPRPPWFLHDYHLYSRRSWCDGAPDLCCRTPSTFLWPERTELLCHLLPADLPCRRSTRRPREPTIRECIRIAGGTTFRLDVRDICGADVDHVSST